MTKLQNNHKSQSNLPRQISAPLNASSAQLSPILPAELIAENIEKVRKRLLPRPKIQDDAKTKSN
ncbi:hypothetical protein RQN30_10575 [Arcanobacterium hippocoleae]